MLGGGLIELLAMESTAVLLNIAYVVLLSSTISRSVLWLRALLVAGAFAFMIYGALVQNWTTVAWNTAFCSMHSFQLYRYVMGRRAVQLSEEDEGFRQRLFPGLDRFDFFSLWSIGEEEIHEDQALARAGEPQSSVYLILDGAVAVQNNGTELAVLERGSLVGEMSFLSGEPANADAVPAGPVRVRRWEQSRLAGLDQLNPPAARALTEFIGRDLARKLSG